jgi:ABC-type transport system involved in multi-copper enzyme maturation permease subunit
MDRGTAALVLAQPVSRSVFLAAKLVAIAIVLGVSTLASIGAAWIYAALLFEPMPLAGWLALALLDWLALCAWAAFTFLASAATGSVTAAAGLGFVAWIGLSIAGVIPQLDRLLPTGLGDPAYRLAASLTDGMDAGRLATAVAGTVVIIAAAVVASMAVFSRRELR